MHSLLEYERMVPEGKPTFDRVREKLVAKDKEAPRRLGRGGEAGEA